MNTTYIFNTAKTIMQSSMKKAALIDLPTYASMNYNLELQKGMICTITYGIRSSINNVINDYFELIPDDFYANQGRAIVSGFVAGYFKYSSTGQNPFIGMLNNAAYELCNNFDSCGNSRLNSAIFTIAVEATDAGLQTYLSMVAGNVPGAVLSAIYGGAKAGIAVTAFINILYDPIEMPNFSNLMLGEDCSRE